MTRLAKILIGVQAFLILFSFIKAQEAEKQQAEAMVQAEIAKKSAEEALRQADLAAKEAATAHSARAEAELQHQLFLEVQAELAKCAAKK